MAGAPAGAERPSWLPAAGPGNLQVPPECWALTFEQFHDFLEACRNTPTWAALEGAHHYVTLYDMNAHFVKPWTRGTGNSVALLMNSEAPLPARLMLSHSWAENVAELSESLRIWQQAHSIPLTTAVWFCLHANYQPGGEVGDVGPTISQQLELDPFRRVIESIAAAGSSALGMVVIHTTTAEVYDRLWCVFEIHVALEAKVHVRGVASAAYVLTKIRDLESLEVVCETARCGVASDEEMIRGKVFRDGGFDRLDSSIRSFRAGMVQDLYLWHTALATRKVVERAQHSISSHTLELTEQRLFRRTNTWTHTWSSSSLGCLSSSIGKQPMLARSSTGSSTSNASSCAKYPFYAVKVARILEMKTFEVHEDLLAAGDLRCWRDFTTARNIIFVSHPWLSPAHPDPHGVQLRVLQAFLRKCLAGECEVRLTPGATFFESQQRLSASNLQRTFKDAYIWIDQCSVPQRDYVQQKNAMDSCPFYVMQANMFIVLAPSAMHSDGKHRDIRGWAGRGWCRLELCAYWLSQTSRPMIVVESSSTAYIPSGFTTDLFNAECDFVADGCFAVEADRKALKPITQSLVEISRAGALEAWNLLRFRHLSALQKRLVDGLEDPADRVTVKHCASDEELLDWLDAMLFKGPLDEAASGHTPLMIAAAEGRVDIARALLIGRADVNGVLKVPLPGYAKATKGWTALHLACWRMHPDVVDLLLDFGANPSIKCPLGTTALQAAAAHGDFASASAIIRRKPLAASVRDTTVGLPFWLVAVQHGQPTFFRRVLAEHGDLIDVGMTTDLGIGTALTAVLETGDPETLSAVLEAGCDGNQQITRDNVKFPFPILAMASRCQWRRKGGKCSTMVYVLAIGEGCSALHWTALTGNIQAQEVLLRWGADVSARNALGQTPLHIAAENGHTESVGLLLKGCAAAGAKDRQGCTASSAARRHGFPQLADLLKKAELNGRLAARPEAKSRFSSIRSPTFKQLK